MASEGTVPTPIDAKTSDPTGHGHGRWRRRPAGFRVFSSASDAPRSRRPTDGILLGSRSWVVSSCRCSRRGPPRSTPPPPISSPSCPTWRGGSGRCRTTSSSSGHACPVAPGLVRATAEAPVPPRGARGGARVGGRDPRQRRGRHRPLDEPLGPHQLDVPADLPRDADRDRHRRDRDGVARPRAAVAARRPMADRDRERSPASRSGPRSPSGSPRASSPGSPPRPSCTSSSARPAAGSPSIR